VIPNHVIAGCSTWDFQARVHSGMVIGWVHKPAGLIVERERGRGKMVVTTFRLLEDAPGADPVATALLDALLELAMSSRPEADLASIDLVPILRADAVDTPPSGGCLDTAGRACGSGRAWPRALLRGFVPDSGRFVAWVRCLAATSAPDASKTAPLRPTTR
jgi:hypothetical protein